MWPAGSKALRQRPPRWLRAIQSGQSSSNRILDMEPAAGTATSLGGNATGPAASPAQKGGDAGAHGTAGAANWTAARALEPEHRLG
jgi:hypothetical protein